MKRRFALAVPVLLMVAACGGLGDVLDDGPTVSIAVEAGAYVGVWRGFQSSAHFDLRADGTFTATGVPVGQLGDLYERTGRVGPFHGHGRWRLLGPTETATPIAREALLEFAELLDADTTAIQPPGTLKLWATTPRDRTAGGMLLETDGDYFQRLRGTLEPSRSARTTAPAGRPSANATG